MTQLTKPTQLDSQDRTWHVLERDGGSVTVYYTRPDVSAHFVVFDTLDSTTDQQAEIDRLRAKNKQLRITNEGLRTLACRATVDYANAGKEADGLHAENERLREALADMLHIFDRDLAAGTIGRKICDEARTALTGGE